MRLLLPGMVLQTMGAGMLIPILPSFAEDRLGLNGKQYSLLLLAGGALTVLGLIPLGRLSDKLGGKKWFLVLGFCCIGGGLYLLGHEPALWQCMLLTGALGLSYAALLPAWNALLANYVPPMQQGLGWGIFSTDRRYRRDDRARHRRNTRSLAWPDFGRLVCRDFVCTYRIFLHMVPVSCLHG